MSIGVDTRMTMSGSAAAGESRQSNVDGTEGELNTDGDQIDLIPLIRDFRPVRPNSKPIVAQDAVDQLAFVGLHTLCGLRVLSLCSGARQHGVEPKFGCGGASH